MSVLSIKQIKEMPAMPIPGTFGTLVEVQPQKQVTGAKGQTTVQSFKLQDANDWIYGDIWGLPDISPWRGQNVIFVSNKSGNNKVAGVSIKEKPSKDGSKTFKNISISSPGAIHTKETYEQNRGAAPTPSPTSQLAAPFVPKPAVQQQTPALPSQTSQAFQQSRTQTVQGVTVGMAINNAIHIMIEAKSVKDGTFDFEVLHRLASGIIGVSQRLERGDIYVDPVDSVVTGMVSNPLSGSVGNPPSAGYTKADTAGIESFDNAIPAPRPARPYIPNEDGPDDDSTPF